MSKTWYPMINYERCTGCGACYEKCPHGVYAWREGLPRVVNPEGCIQGCTGCGALCPREAIEYFGDTESAGGNAACGCENDCGCHDQECCGKEGE
jgi:NAD-dependent dihydropyrimidine dehydrogenase PreA subunit